MSEVSIRTGLAAACLLLAAGPALAEVECAVPAAGGKTHEEVRQMFIDKGYDVRSVGDEDGCVEVKGFDKDGKRVEIYVDPATGAVVAEK